MLHFISGRDNFFLTLWEDFGEVEGEDLQIQIEMAVEFCVILARCIRISPYQDMIVLKINH